MSARHFISALALAASVIAPSLAVATPAPSSKEAPCILSEYRVTSVRPYWTEENIGRASIRKTRGAEVFIQAQPGLTAEWLRLRLSQHVMAMRQGDMNGCSLDVNDVRVDVDSAGAGFSVKLIAKDSKGGEEILRRARLLVHA